jgi:serine protease Do
VIRWSLPSVLVAALFMSGCPSKPSPTAASASAAIPPPPAPTERLPPPPGADTPKSFADLAQKADAAVVFVKTLQEQKGRTGRRRVIGEGLGSAFVYDASGLILTNNHVIENATDIRVIISKKEMKATVVGRDPPTDIAILRVEQKDLPFLPLGDSDAVRVGDWAVAIGNPFGLSHTVSAGIISAKERTGQDVKGLGDGSGYYNFIQTDASINPGNSGGPLLDMAGRVIGINTAIRARANNIGFAIPINMVKELVPRLIADGRVKRSAIGITVSSVTEEDASRLGLAGTNGALVRAVIPGGAADKAGLQVDDVIVGFEGGEIPSPEKLRWMASVAGSGKSVTVKVARGKRTFDMKVTLQDLPDQPVLEQPDEEPVDPFGGGGPP